MAAAYNLKPQRVNAFDLASVYLKKAGFPDTPVTRRMLAAWFMAESPRVSGSSTDIVVYNNNPLNIRNTSWKGDAPEHGFTNNPNFASYSSVDAGAKAFADYLNWGSQRWPSYRGIQTSFRAQDPAAFVSAIKASPWGSAGNLVRNVLAGFGTNVGNTVSPVPGFSGGSAGSGGGAGGSWDVSKTWGVPDGTTLTKEQVNIIMKAMQDSGLFSGSDPLSQAGAEQATRDILESHIGEPWNDATRLTIQGELGTAATSAGDPFGLGSALTAVLDPNNWLHVGAIIVGALLVGYGGKKILDSATGGQGPTVIVQRTERYPAIVDRDMPAVGSGDGEGPDFSAPAIDITPTPIRRQRATTSARGERERNKAEAAAFLRKTAEENRSRPPAREAMGGSVVTGGKE